MSKASILVVDDTSSSEGISYKASTSGISSLFSYKWRRSSGGFHRESPDLIVLDVMHKMDGFAVCRKLGRISCPYNL